MTMPDVEFEYPHVISVEALTNKGAINLKLQQELTNQILREAYKGVVTKEGQWARDKFNNILSPGPDWKIEKQDIGKYKISHSIGYKNTSLSVSLLQSPGSFNILEHHPEYFVIESTLDKIPTDMPFAFSLIKVISP